MESKCVGRRMKRAKTEAFSILLRWKIGEFACVLAAVLYVLLQTVTAHELAMKAENPRVRILDHEAAVELGRKVGVGRTEALVPENGQPLVAASFQEFRFRYTAGKCPIEAGGYIRIAMRHVFHWSQPQTGDETLAGYTRVSGSGDAVLKLVPWPERTDYFDHFLATFPWQRTIEVRVESGRVNPGDTVEIIYGDRSKGAAGAQIQAFEEPAYAFRTYTACNASAPALPSNEVVYSIVGGPVHHLSVVAPSQVGPHDALTLTIRAEDKFGNRARDYSKRLEIYNEDGDVVTSASFSVKHAGVLKLEIPRPNGAGVARFRVSSGSYNALSNPVRFLAAKDRRPKIYWGDLHGHTLNSDGRGTVADFYKYCRDVAALDFCAVTDHGFMISDKMWRRSKQITEAFNQAGSFVTVQAYEWSGMTEVGGDHNVYFRTSDPKILRARSYYDYRNQQAYHGLEPQVNFIEDLYSTLLATYPRGDVLAIPHFGGRQANPSWHDPRVERLVEVYSEHRRVLDWAYGFLKRGYRLGIIASTDNHTGRPGYGFLINPFEAGNDVEVGAAMVAVKAEELSRDAIFSGLYSRKTYATTGDRILLDVKWGDAHMGEEVTAPEPRPFKVAVTGTARIKRVEILRDAQVVASFLYNKERVELSWTDPAPKRVGETTAYWVRVVQNNSEEAVSSPIWWTRTKLDASVWFSDKVEE